ncbi:MAG: N-6 DNA methylase [Thermomicrobiales bacterium]
MSETERLVKSRQRVADHGEVFTPAWLVEAMLDLVKDESERIDARVLEPACGSGNFLVPVLARKLATVRRRYRRNAFEQRHHALLALMCIYGIELLADNAEECRDNLAALFIAFLGVSEDDPWAKAARAVLAANIIQGDALTMTVPDGSPITFPEWGYLGKGTFQRRDFRYHDLTQRAAWQAPTQLRIQGVDQSLLSASQGSLFAGMDNDALFTPVRTWPPQTVHQLAGEA